jgi:hypothetical protein
VGKRKFIINNQQIRSRAAAEVAAIKGDDCMEVIIQPYVDDQTVEQRGFFHVLVKILADELGYSPDSMKQAIKAETWGTDTVEVCEMTVDVIRSSAGAKKDEYSELIETTYRLAANYGVILPNARWQGET